MMFVFSDLSGPFSEPMYEKILRVVKEIKKSVTTIVKAFQDKETSVGGEENLFNLFNLFSSQDLFSNSPECLPYSCCDVSLENLILDQHIIP